ncbi:nitroreductase family protein [Gimibacter soli]|uniref:Putative NAD(P)H nitroreductase n=1 Tax=Gimibacter soli TaxID=3024400 RepID=A0AAE9XRZ7_9PROT|nr:nitroreductase [Gimibacter soli]WCL55039.1 nitroreductase [Gimibacter soli]
MSFNQPCSATLEFLMRRRSVKPRDMVGPGPDRAEMEAILKAATRVPDHGKLTPWRFIVLSGDDRAPLGDLIARALVLEQETSETVAEKMKGYATQGPTLVIAISSPRDTHRIPLMEQDMSVGAACQNLLVAAHAAGFVGSWLTGWGAYSRTVADGLGLEPQEKIAGFIFLGRQDAMPEERPRPDLDEVVTWGWPTA